MNILATSYTLQYKSLDIYVAGCSGNPHCVGCHNPESWNFNQGEKYSLKYFNQLKIKIQNFNKMIDNIMIFGGEPLDQDKDELLHFLFDMKSLGKEIWLFTRYDIEDIPKEVLLTCDYIKTGKYKPEFLVDDYLMYGIRLATSNQKIYKTEEYI